MKTSEMYGAEGELQFTGEAAEAATSLTTEQLDAISAGAPYGLVSTFVGVLRLLLGLL